MPIAVLAVSLVVLLALPLAGRARGVHACLALAAVAWVVALSVTVLTTDFLVSLFDFGEPALHDTYYVVSHVHAQLIQAAILALLALGAWLARPLHRSATISFWIGHIALVAAALVPLAPRPNPDDLAAINGLTGILFVVAGLAFLNLGAMIVMHLAARARS